MSSGLRDSNERVLTRRNVTFRLCPPACLLRYPFLYVRSLYLFTVLSKEKEMSTRL